MEYYRVHADINLDAICKNIEETKRIVGIETSIMAVIKADGYGHGAVPIAKVLENKVDAFGIAILEEGIELRKMGIQKPILILGETPVPLYEQLVKYDIMPTIFQYDMAKALSEEAIKQKKIIKIHIAADTGMSRIGFSLNEESINTVKKISELEGIKIEGCFTHFATADKIDKTFAYKQIERFKKFISCLEDKGIYIRVKHMANSAGIMEISYSDFNMVRAGIIIYGLYPSEDVNKKVLPLEPVMEVKSYITYIKEVEAGTGIGYGLSYVADKKMKVATIPVGYADGYPRALSNCGFVLVRGQKALILGKICMDQFMIDVTDIAEVSEGDCVTLVGMDGKEFISVDELAARNDSINYEFVCDIAKRVPRVYYFQGRQIGTYDFYHCAQVTYNISF